LLKDLNTRNRIIEQKHFDSLGKKAEVAWPKASFTYKNKPLTGPIARECNFASERVNHGSMTIDLAGKSSHQVGFNR
jgi:hypothetical protein